MAIPSLCAGAGSQDIIENVLDALFGMLGLAFILVRFNDPDGGPSADVMRMAMPLQSGARDPQIEAAIKEALANVPSNSPSIIPITIRAVDLPVAFTPLGV